MTTLQALAEEYDGVEKGYVYIMEYKFLTKVGTKLLYKVGVTKNKPIDRMLQVSRSFFQQRRYVPESRLLRFRKIPNYYKVETKLHKLLKQYKHDFKDLVFDGCQEFFNISETILDEVYCNEVPLLKKV